MWPRACPGSCRDLGRVPREELTTRLGSRVSPPRITFRTLLGKLAAEKVTYRFPAQDSVPSGPLSRRFLVLAGLGVSLGDEGGRTAGAGGHPVVRSQTPSWVIFTPERVISFRRRLGCSRNFHQ